LSRAGNRDVDFSNPVLIHFGWFDSHFLRGIKIPLDVCSHAYKVRTSMNVLITGAAGNLGSHLARHMLAGPHHLHLMIHQRPLASDIGDAPNVTVHQADLGKIETLYEPCEGVDCIVHFAGRLFAPRPASFLPRTNVEYVRNLVSAALLTGVKKLILISFPHVEGETTPAKPAQGRLTGTPESIHAQTRLQAEKHLFGACEGKRMVPVTLRPGMIYGRDILMIEAARWLLKRRLLGVWRKPTWIHLIALPDFQRCVVAAIEGDDVVGIYNLGDDEPLTLQEFLDRAALHWGLRAPWRGPDWLFYTAAWFVEAYALLFQKAAPLTRDFIKIGMASFVSDTKRMKTDLVPHLTYPSLNEGIQLL
jgi:nucleoside-diphosphate-sugar epimerase